MVISRYNAVPLYRQVQTVLIERIDAGDLTPGARLPSETDLAKDFGVSRLTVRQAIGELARLGRVRVQHGVGTFVARALPIVDVVVAPLTVTAAQMQAQSAFESLGWNVCESLLGSTIDDEPDAREVLAPSHAVLRRLTTLTSINEEPWMVSTYWFSDEQVPGLTEALAGSGDVFAVVGSRFDVTLRYAWRSFAAVAASPTDAQMLDVAVGGPLLVREGLNHDQHGVPFGYVVRRVRPDRARFVLHYPD